MNRFPDVLNEPSTSRIIIDKTRILLASKKSYELDELKNLLQRTEFVLEEGIQKNSEIDQKKPMETINHTDKRYWIRSGTGEPMNQKNLDRLKEVFGEQLDWLGPVYQNPDETGLRGLFCPFPNILAIKFTSSFNNKHNEFSQKLARYDMEEVTEKSNI